MDIIAPMPTNANTSDFYVYSRIKSSSGREEKRERIGHVSNEVEREFEKRNIWFSWKAISPRNHHFSQCLKFVCDRNEKITENEKWTISQSKNRLFSIAFNILHYLMRRKVKKTYVADCRIKLHTAVSVNKIGNFIVSY